MEEQVEDPARETKVLQRCINDLVSVLSLSSIWRGSEPPQIIQELLDVFLRMLSLDFAYARLNEAFGARPVEILRIAEDCELNLSPEELRNILGSFFAADAHTLPRIRSRLGAGETSIFPVPLGIQGEIGVLVVGSDRMGFPEKAESLLLSVAANQASIGLQEARLRSQQKRISDELDRRVGQRTAELAAANAQLQLQVGLLQHLPVSTWTLKPDGTPDFVNEVWLRYSGQTIDFVRSHPEAWMTAVHPDDREMAAKSFWEGVRSGQGFAFETRTLRAQDNTYRWHLQQAVVLRDEEGRIVKFVGTTTDIDDQKRAQEALRASEGKLQRVIDTIPTLVWCNLPDGSNEFLSESWHAYTGLSYEEAHGWGWAVAFHPDDLPPLMEKWQKMLVSGESGEIEARLRRHDGVYRWFLIRAQAFRDDFGNIVRWYGTSTDIEERKAAERALRESEHASRTIVDSIPGQIAVLSASGELEFLSQPLLNYYGKTLEELKLWTTSDVIFEKDRPGLIDAMAHSITSGKPLEVEARSKRFDGVYRWFGLRGHPLRDRQGHIVRWYLLQTDIDDKKRAEEALRASEASLAQAQHLSRTGSFSWKTANNEIAWSEQLYRIFEFEPGTPVTIERINSRVYPEDLTAMIARIELARASGGAFEYEHRLLMPDGSVRHLMASAQGNKDAAGEWEYMGAVQDITQRRLSEEALTKARAELANVARTTSLGVLTASIAHEVNQPLSGIITNASTCLKMLDANPPNLDGARETARRMIRDGHRASDVITRLRTLYSKKEPTVEPMDLNETAREVTVLSSTEIQKHGVILRQEYADNLPSALGDRIQLQQVILNLLRNAVDAMSTIDGRPRELVLRTERYEGNQIRLSVQDSGIGFTSHTADKIFEPFYTTKTDGMGIGLSISRSIVEAHQGRLWAAPNQGPGSTFFFSIPCRSDRSAGGEIDPTCASGDAA